MGLGPSTATGLLGDWALLPLSEPYLPPALKTFPALMI